jgi:hypothetical protein
MGMVWIYVYPSHSWEIECTHYYTTWVPRCCTLTVTINWWKKWIDFVEIKFDAKENIEWHCMQLELDSILQSQERMNVCASHNYTLSCVVK